MTTWNVKDQHEPASNPERAVDEEAIKVVDNVFVLVVAHDKNLVDNQLLHKVRKTQNRRGRKRKMRVAQRTFLG